MVLVGDLKQLPHVPDKLDYPLCDPLYDNKKLSILASVKAVYKDNISDILLKEHYRCHPAIIRFCNKKFYNDELVVYNNYTNDNAVSVIKTVKGNHSRRPSSGSLFNNREIEEASVICNKLKEDIVENGENYGFDVSSVDDIGFATPFNAQVKAARDKLGDEIEVDTVHKYQGRENDIFIFSTVLDKSKRSGYQVKFVSDPHLVNVAVSRAKKHLVIISSCDKFMTSGNHIGDLIRYANYIEPDNIVESKIYSVFDLLYKDFSPKLLEKKRKLEKLKKSSRKDSSYNSENIMMITLDDVLKNNIFSSIKYKQQVYLKHIFKDLEILTDEERKYIKHNSSVDFLIVNKFDNMPLVAIEVDGYEFHENNEEQRIRDIKKNSIFKKFGLKLCRFETIGVILDETLRSCLLEFVE